jgi:hypothetical protein
VSKRDNGRCECGHAFSSHQDPEDRYNPFNQPCRTCDCRAYLDRMEARMQGNEDEDETDD